MKTSIFYEFWSFYILNPIIEKSLSLISNKVYINCCKDVCFYNECLIDVTIINRYNFKFFHTWSHISYRVTIGSLTGWRINIRLLQHFACKSLTWISVNLKHRSHEYFLIMAHFYEKNSEHSAFLFALYTVRVYLH